MNASLRSLSPARINEMIARVGRLSTAWQRQVQDTGIAAAHHYKRTGDYTLLIRLMDKLPNGARKNSFYAWVEAHTLLAFSEGNWAHNRNKSWKLETMEGKFWYEMTKEAGYKGLDLNKEIKALIAKANKRMEAGIVEGQDNIPVDLLQQLNKLQAYLPTTEVAQ